MDRKSMSAIIVLGVLLAAATLVLADTLVLRDGDRVEGELTGVDGDTIEFKESGFFGRVRSFDRADVSSIEFGDRRDSRNERRRRGTREKEVSVSARSAWTDTGIDVRNRQEVSFSSSGKIKWGKDRRDDAGGESKVHYNANRPIPNRQAAALIGKIGSSSRDYFFIGNEEGPLRMRDSGRLYLGINDDYLPDNSGAFRVTIYY